MCLRTSCGLLKSAARSGRGQHVAPSRPLHRTGRSGRESRLMPSICRLPAGPSVTGPNRLLQIWLHRQLYQSPCRKDCKPRRGRNCASTEWKCWRLGDDVFLAMYYSQPVPLGSRRTTERASGSLGVTGSTRRQLTITSPRRSARLSSLQRRRASCFAYKRTG